MIKNAMTGLSRLLDRLMGIERLHYPENPYQKVLECLAAARVAGGDALLELELEHIRMDLLYYGPGTTAETDGFIKKLRDESRVFKIDLPKGLGMPTVPPPPSASPDAASIPALGKS